ncbi:hypothetical protein KC19_VG107000 [Ceratodon purpureus]|uniref:Pentatricopeptide repeat-containing protein n=1 Tax=Ceratodon purpureus TaxID=3225 RepID=A0A8T0HP18_CERPU|nr:hypothetical protein KC19_VG107000 [Ceratodon purpureus]
MAMAGLSCTRLPVPSHVECVTTASSAGGDVKQGSGGRMELCGGCMQGASSGSWNPLGFGRAAWLGDLSSGRVSRNEEKCRRRLEVALSGTKCGERDLKPCASPFRSWGPRSGFAVVRAALTPEQLEGGSGLVSVKDYNSALLSCVREGRMRDAMAVFKRFQGAGLKPDVVSYTTLIQGFGKLKSYNKVTDVFSQMQRSRCPPDLKFCTVLISTFGNGGLPVLAESAMKYAHAQGLEPDAIAYTALVHAYAQEGLWEEAEKALRDMLDAGVVDNRPYAALVSAYGKAGLMDHVGRLLQTMESSGVEAGTGLFNALINIHSKAGDPEKAREVMQLMQANGEFCCF